MYSDPPVMGRKLMPWISSGLAVHQVAWATPWPQTMPATLGPYVAGKTVLLTSNQYCSMARVSFTYWKIPRSRMVLLPVAAPHRMRDVLNIIASDDDSWLLPAAKAAW